MNWNLIFQFFAMGLAILILSCDLAAFYRSFSPNDHYAYIIVCATFIVLCGFLADRLGRKILFLIGLALFALLSAAGATIPAQWLTAIRAIQGLAAAILWSSILGICYVTVPSDKKSFSIGLLLGAVGLTLALSLFFVHFIPESFSTSHIMWINVVLALCALVLAYFKLPDTKRSVDHHVDYWGICLLPIAVAPLMYALLFSPQLSLDTAKLWLGCSLIFFLLFLILERVIKHPLLNFLEGKKGQFVASLFSIALISYPFFTLLLFLPEYLQKHVGFNLYETSLALIPMLLIWALVSPVAGDLYHYLGAKLIIFIASLAIAVGIFLIGFVLSQFNYYFLLPGMIISGLGYGFGFSSITTLALGSVKEEKASLSGGFVTLFFIIGAGLGLAIATVILKATAVNTYFSWANIFSASAIDQIRGYFWTMVSAALPPFVSALIALGFIKKG